MQRRTLLGGLGAVAAASASAAAGCLAPSAAGRALWRPAMATPPAGRLLDAGNGTVVATAPPDRFYVATATERARELHAVDADGTVAWSVPVPASGWDRRGVVAGERTVATAVGERFGMAGGRPQVRAWDAATGDRLWTIDPPDRPVRALAVGPNGDVICGSHNDAGGRGERLFALAREEGAVRWTVRSPDVQRGWLRAGTVIAEHAGGMSGHEPYDGRRAWTVPERTGAPPGLPIVGGVLPIDFGPRRWIDGPEPGLHEAEAGLQGLDPRTGERRWRATAADGSPLVATAGGGAARGAVDDGRLAAAGNGEVTEIDPATGERLWSLPAPVGGLEALAWVGETLVVHREGTLFGVDPGVPEVGWERALPSDRSHRLLAAGGTVYAPWEAADYTDVATGLWAIDAADGALLWSRTTAGGDSLAVDPLGAALFVSDTERSYVVAGDAPPPSLA